MFRKDHRTPPFLKQYVFMADDSESDDESNESKSEVLGSVFYRHSQPSVDLQRKMFGNKVFPNPKDYDVLARLMRYVTKGDRRAVFLDSFAGSGTTAQAVLAQNRADGGGRRFILVEMDEVVAKDVTATRIRRAVEGYGDTPGLGGGFRFCRLGKTLFDEDGEINHDVPFTDLARYVYLIETGMPAPTRPRKDNPLLGVHEGRAVYLLYNGVLGDKRASGGNVLTHAVLDALPAHPGGPNAPKVVYGEACRLSETTLARLHVTFRQTPYALREG